MFLLPPTPSLVTVPSLVRSGHFASEDISERSDHLAKQMRQLRDAAAVRKLRLMDAQEVQAVRHLANAPCLGYLATY